MQAILVPPDQMYDILTGTKKEIIRIWDPRKSADRLLLCSTAAKVKGYVSGVALCTAEIAKVIAYPDPKGLDPMYGWRMKKMRYIEPFPARSRNRLSFFEVPDVRIKEVGKISLQDWFEIYYDPLRFWG